MSIANGQSNLQDLNCRAANDRAQTEAGLAIVLGSSGKPATQQQVSDFVQFALQRKIDPDKVWVARRQEAILWAALPVLNPGKTTLLFVPADVTADSYPAAGALIEALCEDLRRQDVTLVQVLLDPQQVEAQKFYADHEFQRIAELIYFHAAPPRKTTAPTLEPPLHWQNYTPESEGLFREAILASYRESLDCPSLTGLRDIEDILEGHRATGEFDPALWFVICESERPLGVLLLSRIPHSDALELVYIGLAPEARGRGLGEMMMRLAMHVVVIQQKRRLTLAVDAINQPALRLYYRHGMQRITSKVAMIRDIRVKPV